MQWIEEGKQPTKYFCGLESNKLTSKIIPKIDRDDGKTITKQYDILKETRYFMKNYINLEKEMGVK